MILKKNSKILKKTRISQDFYFKNLTKNQMVELANDTLPINLKHLNIIIDNIHEKYPLISKIEITYVVKALIYTFRDFLILGHTISIGDFFLDHKLYFNKFIKNNKIYYGVKAKIKTSSVLKNATIK